MRKFIEELVEKVLDTKLVTLKIENDSLKEHNLNLRNEIVETRGVLAEEKREHAILKSRVALGIDEVAVAVHGAIPGGAGNHSHGVSPAVLQAPLSPPLVQSQAWIDNETMRKFLMEQWQKGVMTGENVRAIENAMDKLGLSQSHGPEWHGSPMKFKGEAL